MLTFASDEVGQMTRLRRVVKVRVDIPDWGCLPHHGNYQRITLRLCEKIFLLSIISSLDKHDFL